MNFLLVECDKGSEFGGPTKTKLVISEYKYYLMLSWAVFFIQITQSKYIVYFVYTLIMMFLPQWRVTEGPGLYGAILNLQVQNSST